MTGGSGSFRRPGGWITWGSSRRERERERDRDKVRDRQGMGERWSERGGLVTRLERQRERVKERKRERERERERGEGGREGESIKAFIWVTGS
jgi:hypothetical protein